MDKYVFKPYNPISPALFEKEKIKLQNQLGNDVIIEHIGSTAVDNLGGKGIIDVIVGIPKGKISFTEVIEKLEKAGYEHGENADSLERIFFRKDRPDEVEKIRRYHIHVTYFDNNDWKETLRFRDNLRNNPQLIKKYEDLKNEVIRKAGQNGNLYRSLKQPFIDKYSKELLGIE
ncbi:MAG: GrpB family protein [Candidatus Curtissbacteria bacterium]|nr:GrpB family protein [Candidatus Curtissbacteria bacterium]